MSSPDRGARPRRSPPTPPTSRCSSPGATSWSAASATCSAPRSRPPRSSTRRSRRPPAASSRNGSPAPAAASSGCVLAGLVALVLGFGLAIALDRSDTRLRTRQAAEAHYGLPVLAEIPLFSLPSRRRTAGRRRRARLGEGGGVPNAAHGHHALPPARRHRTRPGDRAAPGIARPSATVQDARALGHHGHLGRSRRRQDDHRSQPGRGLRRERALGARAQLRPVAFGRCPSLRRQARAGHQRDPGVGRPRPAHRLRPGHVGPRRQARHRRARHPPARWPPARRAAPHRRRPRSSPTS